MSAEEALGETRVVGELFLTEDGKISYAGMEALAFISADLGYYVVGERAGNAFRDGAALK